MKPTIINKKQQLLAGFSFFGDPFEERDPWSEENEIGKLWARFTAFLEGWEAGEGVLYEVHVAGPEAVTSGKFEVFVGRQVGTPDGLPLELVIKVLPPGPYAVFTLHGEDITGDWPLLIDAEWLPDAGYQRAHNFSIQAYDQRFRGMDALADSALEVHLPVRKLTSLG